MLTIGQLAQRSGIPATTLRYYDSIGLLEPRRLPNGHRRFPEETLERLRLVRLCRRLGLRLDEIAAVLTGDGRQRREVAARRLREVDQRMHELAGVRAVLAHLAECTHGPGESAACEASVLAALPDELAAGPVAIGSSR
ncbi:MerR family transcriptional regulator [Micromonospora mirobrigensis]|uniref:DNA-binding transcriptional regulator, MerR family n=1 Tax=Micromonospora mirobrigensis TaxID=262898 RepID=A0A1C5ALA8_9ACTN|nr:MerR family transcriptional regulator [Micromonospora mirobrigensis]SCF45784.1 DNA-binding transcriptional regulator, MerR family [Micromonospora mirobrigensis]